MTDDRGRFWIDLETFSTVDLRKATPYRYAEDPCFLILMGSYSWDGETVVDVESQEQLLDEVGGVLRDPDVIKVAHNAPFERITLSAALGLPVGKYLPIREWHDTQAVAGCLGYPQKLATLAHALGAEKKDEAGTLLINWFCKPDRNGNRRLPEDHPEKWAAFVRYCHQDVVSLIDVDRRLGDFPTEMEREVYFADQAINDRGMRIDLDLVKRAIPAARLNAVEQKAELAEITGLNNTGNPTVLREWFELIAGVKMPDMQAETVEAAMKRIRTKQLTHLPAYRALELRQELALTAAKKFDAALASVSSDGRLRGSFRYFGAHTGRWSGRGAQPQNLPRHTFKNDADVELGIWELMSGERISADDLKRMVRPMFLLDGSVVDYSSIEARVIAWLAGEEWALQAFREGRDIYVETAERMGGLTRAQGKIAVLALGYGGGVGSLKAMAGPGDDFINDMPDERIRQELVDPWRRANLRIVRLWHHLDEAFGTPMQVGPHLETTESHDELGRAVHLWLPSGRAITYHGVRWERYPVQDKRTKRTKWKEGWRFANPKDPFNHRMRLETYGGRLAENATQAAARDVLAEALVRMEAEGIPVVGHVHDEALTEYPDWRRVREMMITPPAWSAGLPIDGDGFNCGRYRKG